MRTGLKYLCYLLLLLIFSASPPPLSLSLLSLSSPFNRMDSFRVFSPAFVFLLRRFGEVKIHTEHAFDDLKKVR